MANALRQSDYLDKVVQHIDVKSFNAIPLIDGMSAMSFQARNLSRASQIFNQMVREKEITNILCLSGSLVSAGLRKVIYTLIETNMIDCVVSTGANIIDMDLLEALGFHHYIGDSAVNDEDLRLQSIDRIYDTYISEHDLRICDETITKVANRLESRPYSSREFTSAIGQYLHEKKIGTDSILSICFEKKVPIFIPSLSDCAAGFGLALHQKINPHSYISHDSVRDFSELTDIVIKSQGSGLLMIGGGVPKNFAQDTVVLAEILGKEVPMHKFAVQITVADERDGALSGSTLKEAHSWGKVDQGAEQMVFSEATLALPILASYAYHKNDWKIRSAKKLNSLFPEIKLLNK